MGDDEHYPITQLIGIHAEATRVREFLWDSANPIAGARGELVLIRQWLTVIAVLLGAILWRLW